MIWESVLQFVLDLIAIFAVYLIIAISLHIQSGLAGIPNFGLVFAVAGGAYTVGALSVIISSTLFGINLAGVDIIRYNSNLTSQINTIIKGAPLAGVGLLLILVLVAAAIGVILGLIVCVPTIRLREDYLAVTFLMFGEIITYIARAYTPLVGGPNGVQTPDVFSWAEGYRFFASTIVILAFCLIIYVYSVTLSRSPFGRVLRAIRDSALAAKSLGKDITYYRLMVVLIGSALCSIAGALYALYTTVVMPTYARGTWTFLPWLMILIGGQGSDLGMLIGTFVCVTANKLIVYFKYYFGFLPFDVIWLNFILLGILTILILIFRPEGIVKEKPILKMKVEGK